MKKSLYTSKKAGFTLVELLVVIAIIAVLAAAGFAGGNAAIQKARKVTAQSVASSIESGIESFYSDYSALPDPTGSATEDNTPYETDQANGIQLLEILLGLETGTDIQNDKKVRYLSLKEARSGNRDGIVYDSGGTAIQGLFDAWGEPYFVVLDYNYDERITVSPQGSTSTTLNGRRVAVYSLGTDTPSDANAKTLVKTW
ncbi:MAG: prepilin-type N-terminal cleavage/methylation domain-containing protein [Akkermansiaceae bacterium]